MQEREEVTIENVVTREQRNQQLIDKILYETRECLDLQQRRHLNDVLEKCLQEVAVTRDSITVHSKADQLENRKYLEMFIQAKTIEGLSSGSIYLYERRIKQFLDELTKPLDEVTTADVRYYLGKYEQLHEVKKRTMESIRRILNSFFTWLTNEKYVAENPMRRIKRVRYEKTVQKAFSDEDMTRLRDACKDERETAMVEFLLSTGVRCSELVNLDISDVDFEDRSAIVYGKGSKEREVYFNADVKLHLQSYLDTRNDKCPALFKSHSGDDRLLVSGVERVIRELGVRAGVKDCHPHRFRRTMATNAIDHGMPVEQVQRLLGHSNIETTMIYAMVSQENVKNSHRKYVG